MSDNAATILYVAIGLLNLYWAHLLFQVKVPDKQFTIFRIAFTLQSVAFFVLSFLSSQERASIAGVPDRITYIRYSFTIYLVISLIVTLIYRIVSSFYREKESL